MLYDEHSVRDNVRNKDGKRVFFLGSADRLTPSARDWLRAQRIQILPAAEAKPARYRLLGGGFCREKPEHMTHLNAQLLAPKTHGRIAFRGALDLLEAEIILCKLKTGIEALQEALELARLLMRCDVLEQPVGELRLGGLDGAQLRQQSQFPQAHFGIPHFMPEASQGETMAWLNRCRCMVRQAELAACRAYEGPGGKCARPDMVEALNRMSSFIYILMLREKARSMDRGGNGS